MKQITIDVYTFDELSETAKQKAIENNRPQEIFWADENMESLEKFADIFPIKINDWSYGGRGEGVYFSFNCSDEIENLFGQRLATYLWNNYKGEIYSKKYFHSQSFGLTDKKLIHKRVTSREIKNNCLNKGKFSNSYYSAIQIESYNCPLTGYCMDNELLSEIWDFIDKPDNRNFKDLLEHCFDNWIKACNADIESQNSDEAIIETIQANDYEFDINGNTI